MYLVLHPQLCKAPKHTPSCVNEVISSFTSQVISSSEFYSKSCVAVILHQGTPVWWRVSDARLPLKAKMDFCFTLRQWVMIFIACGGFFSGDVSIGKALREIFLMCLCNSMSLEAISPSQRGSAEGVALFCALVGRLSGVVCGDNFWNFIVIVVSSSARWKFTGNTCKRVLFPEINRTPSDVCALSCTNTVTLARCGAARHAGLSSRGWSWHLLRKLTFGFCLWIYDITLIKTPFSLCLFSSSVWLPVTACKIHPDTGEDWVVWAVGSLLAWLMVF